MYPSMTQGLDQLLATTDNVQDIFDRTFEVPSLTSTTSHRTTHQACNRLLRMAGKVSCTTSSSQQAHPHLSQTQTGSVHHGLSSTAGDSRHDCRQEYVDLYTDFVLNKRVSAPFQALKDGFAQICCGVCSLLAVQSTPDWHVLYVQFLHCRCCDQTSSRRSSADILRLTSRYASTATRLFAHRATQSICARCRVSRQALSTRTQHQLTHWCATSGRCVAVGVCLCVSI